jgi:putative cardiolipin synthase
MTWFAAVIVLLAALVGFGLYGRFALQLAGEPSSVLPLAGNAALDRDVAGLVEAHGGQVGLRLLTDNVEAFALRAATARKAERSLDLQYYYWKDDLTGRLLAREVLHAADRGVRIRLLLDDVNALGRDSNYRSLDRHPNIEVRLFNPLRCREGALLRGIEMVLRFWSINRRMHHKAWIADARVAFVGGRNIGDAYFDASEASNFRDMDLLVLGPAVGHAGTVFDRYWNCDMVAPIRNLPDWLGRAELGRLRRRLDRLVDSGRGDAYLNRVDSALKTLGTGADLHWTERATIVSDPPQKAGPAGSGTKLIDAILPVIAGARKSIEITSPYFIPLDSGMRLMLRLADAGVAISVLTNSLAATDVTAVHGAYMRYRKPLLAGGVRLFELRARDGHKNVSLIGSRGASLHTKAFVVDGEKGFVGSFNFDPRSVSLNTEMGLLFEHEGLAREMQKVFAEETEAKRSYRVVLAGDSLRWQDGDRRLDREPDASMRRRAMASIIRLLPVESQL